MRDEGVNVIKTSGINGYFKSFKMLRTRDHFEYSVPTGTEMKYSVPLASGVN